VEDTGRGISKEGQKIIFERFSKLDSFSQGAGLGLSICQGIIKQFEGTISIQSEVGKGSRFCIRLPFVAPEEEETDNKQ
jgi:signal transduction histidine kinase